MEVGSERKEPIALFWPNGNELAFSKLWSSSNFFASHSAFCYLYKWVNDLFLAAMFTPNVCE